MKFNHLIKSGTAILLAVLFFSCEKQNQSTTNTNDGKFKIKITISPPFQPGTNGLSIDGFNSIRMIYQYTWQGNKETIGLSEFYTKEISVKSGNSYGVEFNIWNKYDLICRNIKLEGIQNGKILKTYNFNMGYKDLDGTMCPDRTSQSVSFKIP